MSCLCLALLLLAAVLCRAVPYIIPADPSCPKGRTEPVAWPHAGAFVRFGNGTPQLRHGPEAMGDLPVDMWGCRKFFSRQKVGVVGGRGSGEPQTSHEGVLSFR